MLLCSVAIKTVIAGPLVEEHSTNGQYLRSPQNWWIKKYLKIITLYYRIIYGLQTGDPWRLLGVLHLSLLLKIKTIYFYCIHDGSPKWSLYILYMDILYTYSTIVISRPVHMRMWLSMYTVLIVLNTLYNNITYFQYNIHPQVSTNIVCYIVALATSLQYVD